jgi:transcriptional regulator with XRE-family HTH domain
MTRLVPVIHVGPRSAGERSRRRARLEASLTRQESARVTGASLGTVRNWERGERSPSGAARMLARDPALVIAEAGLAEGQGSGRVGEGEIIQLSARAPRPRQTASS